MFTKVKEDRAERMEPGQSWVMTGRDRREVGKEEFFFFPPFLIDFICRKVLGSRQNPAESKVLICNNHPSYQCFHFLQFQLPIVKFGLKLLNRQFQ